MKNCVTPGSPWRPERPRSWLSIRLDSCLSVPMMQSPPSSLTSSCSSFLSAANCFSSSWYFSLAAFSSSSSDFSKPVANAICSGVYSSFFISRLASKSGFPPSMISVPRPAMLVAIVTAPLRPASATISASFSWCLALSTLCFIPFFLSISLISSDISIEIVPTRTGWPVSCASATLSTIALYLPVWRAYTESSRSVLAIGLLVGMTTTSML